MIELTEERFTIHDVDCDGLFVKDNQEDDIITNDDIVDLLNALLIEKRMLELEIEGLEAIIKTGNCSLLQKENEQLKHDYGQLQYEMSQIIKKYNELEERNLRQYKRLYELWELIFNRDWETLEEKAVEFEENEKLLETEHKATDIHIFYMMGDD